MQQLWLNHKRIDSITQLRSLLSDAAPSAQDELCTQILERLTTGILPLWLERQWECYDIKDPAYKTILQMLSAPMPEAVPTPNHCQALGSLCGIAPERFQSRNAVLVRDNAQKEEKLALLRGQPWWAANAEVFERSVKDWSLVVLSDSELQIALSRLRADHSIMRTLYLCPVKSAAFNLNLRNLQNVTIVGINRPTVRHSRLPADTVIDAKAQQLVLQDFTLQCRDHEAVIHCDGCKQFTQSII